MVPSALPEELAGGLRKTARQQIERKRLYDLAGDCPRQIVCAADYIANLLDVRMNTAIIKRYRLDDPNPSGAYEPHPDPDEFADEPIELLSIDGLARFFVQTDKTTREIHCRPNTLVSLDPTASHWVTPPLNPDGVRHLLFLGFDHSKA